METAIIHRCQKDPEFFFREVLGDDPWPRQIEIAESVRDNRYTAVPSSHSTGKSWIAGRVLLWFTACFPHSKSISTAPTERQVKGIVWGEVADAHTRSKYPLGGKLTTMQWKLDPSWWAMGFTASDYNPNMFQGFHAPNVLVLVDEAAGISAVLDKQIDSLMAGGDLARRLEIGNPVVAGGPFEHHAESKLYNTLPISAFDTPNFTTFGIVEADIKNDTWRDKIVGPLPRPNLITPEWVSERLELWGEDSDAWKSRVLGRFPDIVEGSYYGELLKKAREEGRIQPIARDSTKPVHTAWDIGVRDPTGIWFFQLSGNWIDLVGYYENSGQGLPFYCGVVKDWAGERNLQLGRHFVPHDMANRDFSLSGESRVDVARGLGVHMEILPRLKPNLRSERAEGIDYVRQILPRCRFDPDEASEGLAAMKAYHRKMAAGTGELKDDPEHDWASHGADAFRVLAIAVKQGLGNTGPVRRPKPNTKWVT